jgi:hypothetical protein
MGRRSQLDHPARPPLRRDLVARVKKWVTYNFAEKTMRRTFHLVTRQPRPF